MLPSRLPLESKERHGRPRPARRPRRRHRPAADADQPRPGAPGPLPPRRGRGRRPAPRLHGGRARGGQLARLGGLARLLEDARGRLGGRLHAAPLAQALDQRRPDGPVLLRDRARGETRDRDRRAARPAARGAAHRRRDRRHGRARRSLPALPGRGARRPGLGHPDGDGHRLRRGLPRAAGRPRAARSARAAPLPRDRRRHRRHPRHRRRLHREDLRRGAVRCARRHGPGGGARADGRALARRLRRDRRRHLAGLPRVRGSTPRSPACCSDW